jgi:nitroreductase
MEFFEVIKNRRSCRNLEPVEIPEEDIEKILDAGRRATSGLNKQPYDFLLVREKENIEKIAAAQGFISNASAVIVIIAKPDVSQFWLEDVSAAAENMHLAVTALGYGTTWIEGTLLKKEQELKKHFNIPENMRFIIALPIGKPASEGSQSPKRKLEDIVYRESR